jgi:hypothetical protein
MARQAVQHRTVLRLVCCDPVGHFRIQMIPKSLSGTLSELNQGNPSLYAKLYLKSQSVPDQLAILHDDTSALHHGVDVIDAKMIGQIRDVLRVVQD